MGKAYTMYSTTYDLTNRLAYTTFMSQFDEVVRIDLASELAKGWHVVRLTELFSEELQERAFDQYRPIQQVGTAVFAGGLAAVIALLGAVAYWFGGLALNLFR